MMKGDKTEVYTLDADATGITAEKADVLYTYKGDKGHMLKSINILMVKDVLRILFSSNGNKSYSPCFLL